MFRNLRFYRVTSPWPESEEALSDFHPAVLSQRKVAAGKHWPTMKTPRFAGA